MRKEKPRSQKTDLQHASSESVYSYRKKSHDLALTTKKKNVKWKSQANSLKAGEGGKRPFASHNKVKRSTLLITATTKLKRQRAPSPGKRRHYSSVQLSQSTQFSYQHHFMTVINKNKAHGRLSSIVKKNKIKNKDSTTNIHAWLITI